MWKTGKGFGNQVLHGDGFYISFITSSNMGRFFDPEVLEGETALVTPEGYLILNGDHRQQYQALVPLGLEKCKEYYYENSSTLGSKWSSSN